VAGVGGVSSMVLKEPTRDYGSHSPDHGIQDCSEVAEREDEAEAPKEA
jgi:hypothetical protein